jgi:hypothetical protein
MTSEALRETAKSNALGRLRNDKRLPSNVFSEVWTDYLFFEPDMMFDAIFIDVKDLILREEQSSVVALINLGNREPISQTDGDVFFLDQGTRWEDYMSRLKGDGSALNWLFLMDRYVCASDAGTWCIYCEKENDVATFALRQGFPLSICSRIETLLKAKSIRLASNQSSSHDPESFEFAKLIPSWRSALMTEYVPLE